MRFFFSLLFVIATSISVNAMVTIRGVVSDRQNKGVSDVMVTLQSTKSDAIEAYSLTDIDGSYQLEYNGTSDSVTISISGFNMERQSKKIVSKAQMVNFHIVEKEIALREVQVKSKRIWGAQDTINYLVSSFSNASDRTIGDVLRKMPGIKVEENGEIKYNGKAINKFYIENLDLLQGRYGIATNNIQPKDIATVQVLENHQPVKALQYSEISTDPAINLKLKDGAKGILSMMGQLGLGVKPLLWNNELCAMYFGKKHQHISTYKGNNSGNNVTKELTSFTQQNNFGDAALLSIQMPSPPDIKQSRYLFNTTHALSINNLLKTSKDRQWNFNLSYINDVDKRESYSLSSYYLSPDSTLTIAEDANAKKTTNKIESDITLNVNKNDYYLSNVLTLKGSWQKGSGDIKNSDNSINQQLKTPEFEVLNDLWIINKKGENKNFTLHSSTAFKSNQYNLIVRPGLYQEYFKTDNLYDALQQKARINAFRSVNEIALFSFAKNYFRIKTDGKIDAEAENLNSRLEFVDEKEQALTPSGDSLKNDLSRTVLSFRVIPQISYNRNALKIDLSLPLNYELVCLNEKKLSNQTSVNDLYFNPSFSLQYKPGFKSELNISYSNYHQQGDFRNTTSGYLLTNYRSLTNYNNNLLQINGHNATVNWSYRDLLLMFFGGISLNYNYFSTNKLSNLTYFGNLGISEFLDRRNENFYRSITGQTSKGFNFLSSVFSLNASYGEYSSKQAINGVINDYTNSTMKIDFSTTAKPYSWLAVELSSTWGKSSNKIDEKKKYASVSSLSDRLNLTILLPEKKVLKIDGEHYFNSATHSGSEKNIFFADAEYMFDWRRANLSIAWTNIFDTDQYITSYFSNVSSCYNVYSIRPTAVLVKVKFNIM